MRLAGLADAVLTEPTLAGALADARDNAVPALDLTGPAALRPFVVAGLARTGRTVLVVTATVREAEDLVEELADVVDPASLALYPAWETEEVLEVDWLCSLSIALMSWTGAPAKPMRQPVIA